MANEEREQRFSERMSDSEALKWNIEKDPWLNPSGAAVVILDRPVDMDHFRRTLRDAVAQLPRMYERVVPGLGRLAPPVWVPDPEFDINYHQLHLRLPEPGTERQLFDLAAQLYQEPFDRTRPLWKFVLIDGLEGGRSAIYAITHHVVADGIGQMRMAELYQQLDQSAPAPDEVDLEGIVAEAVAAHKAKEVGGDFGDSIVNTTVSSVSHLVRRQLGIARRVAGELAVWPADPKRAIETTTGLVTSAKSTVGSLVETTGGSSGGSPLWATRSRHRHLEHVWLSLDDLKLASKRFDASINDLFMAAMIEGAVRYHVDRDSDVEAFNTSFVVSTRTDDAIGGNSFTPVPVQLDGGLMPLDQRVDGISLRLAAKKEEVTHGGGLSAVAGVANLLPTSVVTQAGRAQAARMDFATSNLRGAPFPLYSSGARVVSITSMGPLAGTACNATAMSYDGGFDVGLFIDPVAINDPGDFRDAVDDAFTRIIEA